MYLVFFSTLLSVLSVPKKSSPYILQDTLLIKNIQNCGELYSYSSNMIERQNCLDKLLPENNKDAYLWQQKAMPYFKVKEYGQGMKYLNKAVLYDEENWLPYRAFIKCIFSKEYTESIADFEQCILKWGDKYEMDHTYTFYIGLSYLQLGELEFAKEYFSKSIIKEKEVFKEIHHITLFYYGIILMELQRYTEAIDYFNQALENYPRFSDSIYYKALCFYKLNNDSKEFERQIAKAEIYAKAGNTFVEANEFYEIYPYQKYPELFISLKAK